MSVTYSEKAKKALGEAEVVRTNAITTEVLNEYPYPPMEARWDASEDSVGRTVFTLWAKDPEEAAERVLDWDDVKSVHHLRFQLYQLIGDLLRERSNKLIGRAQRNGGRDGQED